MMEQVVLEMDLAADKLQDLEGQGLAQPDVPGEPAVPSSSAMLGQIISSQRHYGTRQERIDAEMIWSFLQAHRAAEQAQRQRDGGPEYVGAWIPDKRELVLNGNGRH
jgi:hypothetical protein